MAETSGGDYYYIAGTVNEQLDSFAFYEDSNSDLVFYDEANDEEPKYVAGSGFDVPASRGYRVNGTQVIGPQESGNVSTLTDNSGGTADDTVEAVSGSGADAAINNNFAELADEVNGIITTLQNHGLHA